MEKYLVVSCPTTELSYTNKAILNPSDNLAQFQHIAVRYPKKNDAFVFTTIADRSVNRGHIAFNLSSRKWGGLTTNSDIEAAPYKFDMKSQLLNSITFTVDFASRQNAPVNTEFNTEDMAKQFSLDFNGQAFTYGQLFGFAFLLNNKRVILELKVKDLQAISIDESNVETSSIEIGLTTSNTVFLFEKAESSDIRLIGGMTGKVSAPQIFTSNLDFSSLGIGGLSEQFNRIFRRAFASRLLPPDFAQAIGEHHVRGILLYGPPGTGKTLIARQIGSMLLSREPKVVNGPEVLNKFVGESEANIRKLFLEAEEEQAKLGINSGLHVIIFDEIDAICKSRGNSASSSGVGDNVVNQLLSKIDGVNSLHNVLLIGMTNRRDLIDEALLRPGRLEVQVEIGLPNEEGRLEIFKIHTKKLIDRGVLASDVSLEELAAITKNYTGAEIAGLVGAARSYAIARVIKPEAGLEITKEMLDSIEVKKDDFVSAMKHEIKPALGASETILEKIAKPIIVWDPAIELIKEQMSNAIMKTLEESSSRRTHCVLIVGEANSGLTTIGGNMAAQSKFPFIRVFQAKDTAGEVESVAIQYMKKLFHDAERSEQSCILFDDIDVILRYCHIGPRFSDNLTNLFIQNIKDESVEHRRLIICTCENQQAIRDLQIEKAFQHIIRVPSITTPEQVGKVLVDIQQNNIPTFTQNEREELMENLERLSFKMGVKTVMDLAQGTDSLGKPGQRVKTFIQSMSMLNLIDKGTRLDQPFRF